MDFRYIGNGDSDPKNIKFMGRVEFVLNEVTDVQDEEIIKKLTGNPAFEKPSTVAHAKKAEEVKKEVEEETKQVDEPVVKYMDKVKAIAAAGVKLESKSKASVDKAYEELTA